MEPHEAEASSVAERATPPHSTKLRDALLVFVTLTVAYHANGSFLAVSDAVPNAALPILFLEEGRLTFTPEVFPGLFEWRRESGAAIAVDRWDQPVDGSPAHTLRERGQIELVGPRYYLSASTRRGGEYLNYYGLGTGLVALPAFAVAHVVAGELSARPHLALLTGKLVAAACVAGSAVFVYLAAGLYCSRRGALLAAYTYGLGTCVYSVSSQALWQHAPNALCLALGAYLMLRAREHPRFAAACGLVLGVAVLSRPTSFVFVVVAGLHLWRLGRGTALAFVAGGALPALVLVTYQTATLGAPWRFAQATGIASYVEMKTGSPDAWPFRWHESVPGLLISPSRGLFLYSPVVAFAVAGGMAAWRDTRFADLRPLTLATLAMAAIQFSWFDWWGGWSFGYRPLVDLMPFAAILLAPIVDGVFAHRRTLAVYAVTLAFSVAVQLVGAFAHHSGAWNIRYMATFEEVETGRLVDVYDRESVRELQHDRGLRLLGQGHCDVDRPECRHRLWSIRDSQLVYLVGDFAEQAAIRRRLSRDRHSWAPDG